jgi:Na+/melibiose symporter-like transporter
LGIAVAMYLPQYFAKNLGLGLAAVGAAFALIRLIDIPVDPLLGVAMDRTTSAWGRYRPWMLLGAPLLMLSVHMLFSAPYGISTTYVIIWLLVMYLGSSMITLSQSAWAATLATSYDERGRVFGAIGAAGVAGMTLLLALPMFASALLPSTIDTRVPQMGLLIVVATPLSVVAAVAMTPERIAPHKSAKGVTLQDYISLLFNPNMARVSAATFLFTLGTYWEGGLYLFYYTDVRRLSAANASMMLLAALAAGLAGAPAISWFGAKTSKDGDPLVHSPKCARVGAIPPIRYIRLPFRGLPRAA